ncbi:hypothetical protein [Draconibacterium sediminis]|uniref:hypothetical protein n=1 Tax=Draconibacterium sediminis TaxID=1544798 RepID=UPI0026EDB264|nr:hypothetical protein [Draconibacterium sediminis]
MKILLTNIFITILTLNLYSQDIKYQLIVKDTCNNTNEVHYSYWIYQDTTELQEFTQPQVDWINGYSILKDTGTYYLSQGYYWGIPDRNPFHKVQIPEFRIYIDTIILEPLQEVFHYNYNPAWTEYLCCGEPCNGLESSFYENGNLKMKGEFINGQPIGDLTKYYYSGELREKNTFHKNSRIYRYFDLNGNLIKRYSEKRSNSYPYWLNEKIEYFDSSGFPIEIVEYKNGDIKRKIKYKSKGIKQYETKRNQRIDYFDNGNIKSKLNWTKSLVQYEYCWNKLIFWDKDCWCCNEYDFTLKYHEFDKEGNLILKAKFDSWDREKNYYPETYLDADWIRYFEKFEDNQIIEQINDSDIDDIE